MSSMEKCSGTYLIRLRATSSFFFEKKLISNLFINSYLDDLKCNQYIHLNIATTKIHIIIIPVVKVNNIVNNESQFNLLYCKIDKTIIKRLT